MANVITGYPFILDTAGGSAITTDFVKINKIRWIGATTAGHQAVIQDQNGNTFWESVASGANYVEESDFTLIESTRTTLSGLKVPTLGSGKLEIYVG